MALCDRYWDAKVIRDIRGAMAAAAFGGKMYDFLLETKHLVEDSTPVHKLTPSEMADLERDPEGAMNRLQRKYGKH